MLYKNTAKVRKLIGVRRKKTWVQPGETVDLDSFDVRHLGMNAAFFEPFKPEPVEKPEPPAEEPKDEAPAEKPADKKEEPEKKEPPTKTKKQLEADKKAEQKAAKKKESDARKALKESLTGMTKTRLIEVGEDVIGVDVKSRDRKEDIIKQLLKAAKDKGYEYVLKNS